MEHYFTCGYRWRRVRAPRANTRLELAIAFILLAASALATLHFFGLLSPRGVIYTVLGLIALALAPFLIPVIGIGVFGFDLYQIFIR